MSKNWGFGHSLGNATIIFLEFLHDDRGQHCATSVRGDWFHKKYQGCTWKEYAKV